MRTSITVGSLLLLAVAQSAIAGQIVLSPLDDGQLSRTAYGQPYVLTNPSPFSGLVVDRDLEDTGELHEGFAEYSLASLPNNATVTSGSLSFHVGLYEASSAGSPSLSVHLFDGGDGQITYADISKSLVNVAQSQDITGLGVYTTDFMSAWCFNHRDEYFPSGYVGLDLSARVEDHTVKVWSLSDVQYGFQPPKIILNYTVPEPASFPLFGVAAALLFLGRRKMAGR